MKRTESLGLRLLRRLGLVLVVVSFPVWGASFVIPVLPLPLETPQRLTLAVGFFVASEIAFWLGFLMLGPAMLERWRRLRLMGWRQRGRRVRRWTVLALARRGGRRALDRGGAEPAVRGVR